jgi:alpha-amylase
VGVMLQAAYRSRSGSVPAPVDGDPSVPWWWDRLAGSAHDLRLAGFSAVLLPPVLKTSSGAGPHADGYGVFDDYDLGNKDQKGSVPTRFGSREQLQRSVAVLRANGLDVYVDTVPHQRNGGDDFVYRYPGADGAPGVGRFGKDPGCFFPNVPRDPVAGPVRDDFPFGDELCPVNARPHGYVLDGLTAAGDWMTRALDVQGYRVDDVKGLAVQFVRHWLTSKAMATRFAVGEYFDGNPQTLNWWVWNSGMGGRCALFDFALRFTLAAMCANPSSWDMSQLDHAGLTGISPAEAVTFIENPDTDGSSPVMTNKLLAYAYLLTAEGYPCVFYRDYATDPGCYGLKPRLDNLIWIHENLAFGTTVARYKDFQSIVYERQGHPNLLVGLNNEAGGGWRTLTVQTGFGGGVQLHDYTGHAGDVWTDGAGRVTIGLPPNVDGTGYVAYSRLGHQRAFEAVGYPVTQSFDGSADLDIAPVSPGRRLRAGRVWCRAGTSIQVSFASPGAVWPAGAFVLVEVLDGAGRLVVSRRVAGDAEAVRGVAASDGWHAVWVSGAGTPQAGLPYTLAVSYTGTQRLGDN